MAWRRDSGWDDVALTARDGRMGRPRCEVLRVCTHTTRRRIGISVQIWRWRAGLVCPVTDVAGVAIVNLDDPIYVQTRILDGPVRVDHAPMTV